MGKSLSQYSEQEQRHQKHISMMSKLLEEDITEWEEDFVTNLFDDTVYLTESQAEKLEEIYARYF